MIIYGTKHRTINGSPMEAEACSHCGQTAFNSYGLMRYFHLYHIPTVPLGKTVGVQCMHCKRNRTGKELPTELTHRLKAALFSAKHTLTSMIGLIVLLLVAVALYTGVKESNAREGELIAAPAAGDLYTIRFSKVLGMENEGYDYGLMKATRVMGELVSLTVSNVGYNKAKGIRKDISKGKVNDAGYFSESEVAFTINDLQAFHASNGITAIKRP